MQSASVTAVLVAAGKSQRMGFDKLQYIIVDKSVLEMSVAAFATHNMITAIVIVAGACRELAEQIAAKCTKPCIVIDGGATRAQSVAMGMACVHTQYVAIHDAARPFVSSKIITDCINAAIKYGAAAPAVQVKDTIKRADANNEVIATLVRSELCAVQTPQVFDTKQYLQAMQSAARTDYTDDCQLLEQQGQAIKLVKGEYANYKITTKEDIKEKTKMRIGHGYDVHKLVQGRSLILGGIKLEYEKGLLGHSDADVLTHAVMDALLGAAALGDIGKLFPDNDSAYAGADSIALLHEVVLKIEAEGYKISNVDCTVICQEPKLRPYIDVMRARLCEAMKTPINAVSVKATTEEGLGYTGAKQGIAAHAVVLLENI